MRITQALRRRLVRRPPYRAVPLTPPTDEEWEQAWAALAGLGPRVVGATGGSGTRVVARALREAGMFIGDDLNKSEDAVQFAAFSDRWINRYQRGDHAVAGLIANDLRALVIHHTQPRATGQVWGWKEPRSIYLLPVLDQELPGLRFLHVVRDGRDIAYSANRVQLRKHGEAVLGASAEPDEVRSIGLWSEVNLRAADYGERELGERYLRIRFEDLCAEPPRVIEQILCFFDLDADPGRVSATVGVHAPPTLGRWRTQAPASVARLEERGGDALAKFGYGPIGDDSHSSSG